MRRVLILLTGLILAVVMTACSTHPAPARGTVSGVFAGVGGPVPVNGRTARPIPLSGRIVAISSAGQRVQVKVGRGGKFTLSLRPGTYRLLGYNPAVAAGASGMECGALHPVRVGAGTATAHVEVTCAFQ